MVGVFFGLHLNLKVLFIYVMSMSKKDMPIFTLNYEQKLKKYLTKNN